MTQSKIMNINNNLVLSVQCTKHDMLLPEASRACACLVRGIVSGLINKRIFVISRRHIQSYTFSQLRVFGEPYCNISWSSLSGVIAG